MWIFTNSAFLSAVQHRDDPRLIMLRARKRKDLTRVLPAGYPIWSEAGSDYAFRAVISRPLLKSIMERAIDGIDYANFKNSVTENDRHDAYMDVWTAMYGFQTGRYNEKPRGVYSRGLFETIHDTFVDDYRFVDDFELPQGHVPRGALGVSPIRERRRRQLTRPR